MVKEHSLMEGQSIFIETADDERNRKYKSRVEGTSPHELQLAVPTFKRIPVRFPVDSQVIISYMSDEPGKGCRWMGKTRVKELTNTRIPLVIVEHPQEWIRKQDRRFVRVPCNLKATIYAKTGDINGQIVDLSGGGVKVILKSPLHNNEKVVIRFELSSPVRTKGRALRVDPVDDKHSCAMEFMDLGEGDRDQIIKYVFTVQRDLRKKGLL